MQGEAALPLGRGLAPLRWICNSHSPPRTQHENHSRTFREVAAKRLRTGRTERTTECQDAGGRSGGTRRLPLSKETDCLLRDHGVSLAAIINLMRTASDSTGAFDTLLWNLSKLL